MRSSYSKLQNTLPCGIVEGGVGVEGGGVFNMHPTPFPLQDPFKSGGVR